MRERAARKLGLPEVGYFLLAALAAPFLVTGGLQLLPDAWAGAWAFLIPFVAAFGLAATAWRRLPAVAIGLATGTIAWALFLYWLVRELDTSMRGFD